MTTVLVKRKDGQLIKKSVTASVRPKATKEDKAQIKQEINERKKLVPNRNKRMAVLSLAESKSLDFSDALQIINKAEEEFVVQKTQQKLAAKERRTSAKKSKKTNRKVCRKNSDTESNQKKIWVSFVSGGGGPGTGKRR